MLRRKELRLSLSYVQHEAALTTQPEGERTAKQLLLRLEPVVIARLRTLAEKHNETLSEFVTRLVKRAR